MSVLRILFWISGSTLAYAYIGYPILLYILTGIRRLLPGRPGAEQRAGGALPTVTLLVAAFNEEGIIEKKIRNCLALEYPGKLLDIVIVTDGSTDHTPDIVRRFEGIRCMHQAERKGKLAAVNRAMQTVNSELVIFSDANSMLNSQAVHALVIHFADPRVGAVAGEKRVMPPGGEMNAAGGEGIYWSYESRLKKLDASFYSVVGAAGELFCIRRGIYEFLPENIIIEDFVQSLSVCMKGYVVHYEPGAVATESASLSVDEEEKRRIRISAGAFQAMVRLKSLLNVFKYPKLSFLYISHRVLRWTLCPLCIPLFLLANAALVPVNPSPGLRALMVLQVLFYGVAAFGWLMKYKSLRIRFLYVPYYFLFMNLSLLRGFFRFVAGRQPSAWDKALRS